MPKEPKLNEAQMEKATAKVQFIKLAQQDLNTYVQACMDGLGLKGDWSLNMDTGVFTQEKKEEPPPPEGKGAQQ